MTEVISDEGSQYITTIDSGSFASAEAFPDMSIQIPSDLLLPFTNQDGAVRTLSYIYNGVEDFFSSGLSGTNRYVKR